MMYSNSKLNHKKSLMLNMVKHRGKFHPVRCVALVAHA